MMTTERKMRQLVLLAPRQLEWQEAPVPTPGPGEALVKVRVVGVCGSDLHAFRGHSPFVRYPLVMGHELALEVVEVADDDGRGLQAGDRVTLEPIISCGKCYPCRHGHPNACTELQVMGVHTHGGLREYFAAPVRMLHKTEVLDWEALALIEPVSIGAHAVNRAGDVKDEWVLVIGAGTIGIGAMQFARCRGAKVAIGDVLPERLKMAARLGADFTIDLSDRAKAVKEVMELTDGEGAGVVIEAVGLPQTIESTVDYVAAGGKVVIVGVGDRSVTFPQKVFVAKELDFMGSRNGYEVFPKIMAFTETGRIRMRELVSHRFDFPDAAEAFPFLDAHQREVSKALITVC